MSPDPGWYADPLAVGRLRHWDGTKWTDRTQPRPAAMSARQAEAETERRHRRTVLIDGVTLVVVIAFLIGIIELGWRKSASTPRTRPTAALAVSTRGSSRARQTTNIDVVTGPASPPDDPGRASTAAPPLTAPIPPTPPIPPMPPPTLTLTPTVPGPPAAADNGSSPGLSSSQHDYTLTGYLWNTCHPITVSSNGPDVSDIVAELAAISGLPLQLVSGPADIMVGWGAMPVPRAIGVTQGTAIGVFLAHVTVTLAPRGGSSLPSLLRHELAHAVGLGHSDQSSEIMYPVLRADSPNDYQAGDRAGLQQLGASAANLAHC